MKREDVLLSLRRHRARVANDEENLARLKSEAKQLVELLDRTTGDEFTEADERLVISIYWGGGIYGIDRV